MGLEGEVGAMVCVLCAQVSVITGCGPSRVGKEHSRVAARG